MRKYNSKTKRTILIIVAVFVIFIIIFSLFIKRSIDVAKTAYEVNIGSILFDNDKNMITTTKESTIKMKWAGNYYLQYNDEKYNLGSHSVVYNSNNGDITLYGKYYEVKNDGKVKVIKDENKIKSSVNSNFYKLADRKYLIVDRTIESTNSSLVTTNYLIINLDKSGNATLLNDKVSLKTIKPTILKTSAYTFDIANEKLNFGGEDIDLKKIIGSTNEYDEDKYNLNKIQKEENDGTGSGGTGSGGSGSKGSGSRGTGTGTNGQNGINGTNSTGNGVGNGTTKSGNSTYNNNYDSAISDEAVDQIIKATKNTSVIRVIPKINGISVDYVIYDPDNEYQSVYIEVENTQTSQKNIVYLSKTNTNIVISELTPNVYYNLTFKYTYKASDSAQKETVFDEVGVYTKIPQIIITVPKIVDNKIYYTLEFDDKYTITGGTLYLLLNGQVVTTESISAMGNVNRIGDATNYFDIKNIKIENVENNIFTIKLVSLSFNTYTITPDITYKFRY